MPSVRLRLISNSPSTRNSTSSFPPAKNSTVWGFGNEEEAAPACAELLLRKPGLALEEPEVDFGDDRFDGCTAKRRLR